jgi:DNA repair exonuclease SbcCD ATPase subunit
MKAIKEFRTFLEQKKGQQIQLESDIQNKKKLINEYKKKLYRHEQAREIIKEVAIKTQEQLQFHISDITSMALETVFENAYKLEIEFIQRKNKTECDVFFSRNGNKVDPLSSSGGGAVDIASFALRIASWSLTRPNLRNTIILDEPMKFVSKEYREQTSQMLKEISDKLDIQFIIVTHDPILTKYADKVFEVNITEGISNVIEL